MKNIKVSLDLKTKKQIFENIQIGVPKKRNYQSIQNK